MKRLISSLIPIAFIILLFIVGGLIIKQQQIARNNNILSDYLKKSHQLFNDFSNTISTFVRTSGIEIPDFELIDSKGNINTLSEIVKNEKMLVYLPKISCNSCTNRETELINTIFGEKIKEVMIVSNFQSLREQIFFERESNIASYSLKKDVNFPLKEYEQQVVIFLISKSLLANCVLVPDEASAKIAEIYYQSVAKRNLIQDE